MFGHPRSRVRVVARQVPASHDDGASVEPLTLCGGGATMRSVLETW